MKKAPKLLICLTLLTTGAFFYGNYVLAYDATNTKEYLKNNPPKIEMLTSACESAILYENLTTGNDTNALIGGATEWRGMGFTSSSTHTICYVKAYIYRVGSPGNITMYLYENANGKPTGNALTSGITDGDTLGDSTCEWRQFDLDTPTEITAETQYSAVLSATSGTWPTAGVRWCADESSPPYAGGTEVMTSDGGSTWSTDPKDMLFEEWGYVGEEPPGEESTSTTSSFITNADTYPFIFFFVIAIFLASFIIVIKV